MGSAHQQLGFSVLGFEDFVEELSFLHIHQLRYMAQSYHIELCIMKVVPQMQL